MKKRVNIIQWISVLIISNTSVAQEPRYLTYEEAIAIALNKSYTVKSHLENKIAMQQYFNYYKAMFKPRLDFELFAPSWNESVSPVPRPDGLPVYNSAGSMQFGGNLQFTYMLPTGGHLALSSRMYRDNISTVLAMKW